LSKLGVVIRFPSFPLIKTLIQVELASADTDVQRGMSRRDKGLFV